MDEIILILDHDKRNSRWVRDTLQNARYRTHLVSSMTNMKKAMVQYQPDLIICVGKKVTADKKKNCWMKMYPCVPHATRILCVCENVEEKDVIHALYTGADDMLILPATEELLLAKTEALLRRNQQDETDTCQIGSLKLNKLCGQAFLNGQDLLLTHKEFSVLLLLTENIGQIIKKEELYQKIWGRELVRDSRSLWTVISRLKKKLEKSTGRKEKSEKQARIEPNSEIQISVIRNQGYCLTVISDQ